MSKYRASEFFGETPPPRIIGTEFEYSVQFKHTKHVDTEENQDEETVEYNPVAEFCNPYVLNQIGIQTAADNGDEPTINRHPTDYYLSNGGRIYKDVGDLIEYCTPESLGPLEAAAADMAGTVVMRKLGILSPIEHRGVFKRTGSIISSEGLGYKGTTAGYHENFLIPDALFTLDNPMDSVGLSTSAMSLFLATRMWTWNGSVGLQDYELSQKFRGVGGQVTGSLQTRTQHGNKPIAILRSGRVGQDTDVNKQSEFGRFEVRLADSTHSGLNKYLSYAATSLVLRLYEHADLVPPLRNLAADNPIEAAYIAAQDRDFRDLIEVRPEYHLGALDIQEMFLELFEILDQKIKLPQEESEAIPLLRELIDDLRKVQRREEDIALVADRVEWAAKYVYLRKKLGNAALVSNNVEATSLDLLWDRIEPVGYGVKFAEAVQARRSNKSPVSTDLINHYVYHPPAGTRANARARALTRQRNKIKKIEWNSIIIEPVKSAGFTSAKTIYWHNPYAA